LIVQEVHERVESVHRKCEDGLEANVFLPPQRVCNIIG
jgi:hypothetical protein